MLRHFPLRRLLPLSFAALLAGCHTTGGGAGVIWSEGRAASPHVKPAPPPHAPAWGRRARHHYYYYPDVAVYFDPLRRVYFYLSGERWRMAAELPLALRSRVGSVYVEIESELDRPYLEYEAHRRHYPPGQLKKQPGHRGKSKNRDQDKRGPWQAHEDYPGDE